MNFKNIWIAWQNFWFKPQSPLPLCIFRFVFGLVFLTQVFTQYWTDFYVFFGEHPIIDHRAYVAYWQYKDILIDVFDFVPMKNAWHIAIFVILGITAIMMTIGFCTRASTFINFIICTSIGNQFPFLCNAGDDMQRLVLFLLLFTRASDAFSVDCLLKTPRRNWYKAFFMPPPVAPWGQRMLQLQLTLAYLSTALIKFNSDPWFYGNGLNLGSRLTDFTKFSVPFLLDRRFMLYMGNYITLVIEFSLGSIVWFEDIRYWVLLCGVIFQLIIDWTMNIPVFEFAFISMYILFIDSDDIYKLANWFKDLYLYLKIKQKSLTIRSTTT